MAGYYDPNKDYSVAIEQAKASGASQSVIQQLQQERQNKIDSKYGGVEPVMYGSDKTYSQLSGANAGAQNQEIVRNAVNTATAPSQSAIKQQMEQAAAKGDWHQVGTLGNQLATPDGYYGGYNMESANAYMDELTKKYGYNAADYHAGGGTAGTGSTQKAPGAAQAVSPGLSVSTGFANEGVNDMIKYLEDMYAQNLEAELNAIQNAYDANVAELESQNDKIAEQYRTMRNQAAAQNALETQAMNERALALGLNTGTSGQMALAQNMAYQNNLGNLWAQEAQQQAESNRLLAQLMREYNSEVNQAAATISAQRAEALYQELLRQDELAIAQANAQRDRELYEREWQYMLQQDKQKLLAAQEAAGLEQERYEREWQYMLQQNAIELMLEQEAARIKQEQADREWAYMLEQDELDRQLAYDQLAAKNNSGGGTTPKLTYNQVMDAIDRGNITPGVMAAYEAIMGVPYVQEVQPGMTEDAIAKAAADFRKASPNVYLDDRTIDYWLHDNGYSNEAAQLFKAYLEEYGATYSRR